MHESVVGQSIRSKSSRAGTRCTGSLSRYLRQQFLIRDSLSRSFSELLSDPDPSDPDLEEQLRYQLENTCIRSVDNFLSYISEVLQLAFRRKPEMLRSSETITLSDVLRFSSYANLLSFLIDKKINSLAYQNISDIEKYIRERTNIELATSDQERGLLVVAIELRNIYSHNRGEVSEITISRLVSFDHAMSLEKGRPFETNLTAVEELVDNLMLIAKRLDRAFARKFRLRLQPAGNG